MSWIDILKRQEVAQTSQTGMAPIDIQKPFKRVKGDDEDCFNELVRVVEKIKNSFPNGEKTQRNKAFEYHYREKNEFGLPFDAFSIYFRHSLERGKVPDKIICETIKMFKALSDGDYKWKEIDHYFIQVRTDEYRHSISILDTRKSPDSEEVLYIEVQLEAYEEEYRNKLNEGFDNWSGFF